MFDLNVRTMLNMSRAVVPAMLKAGSGRIINVGANGALRGGALMGAYAATKASVIRLTESMSAELATQGIGVNCVLPPIIDTPQHRPAMPENGSASCRERVWQHADVSVVAATLQKKTQK